MATDNLAALYAQYLAGGTPHNVNAIQVQGPNIPGMNFADMGGGDGGMSGFTALAEGVLSYLDNKEKAKTQPATPAATTAPAVATPPQHRPDFPYPTGQVMPQPGQIEQSTLPPMGEGAVESGGGGTPGPMMQQDPTQMLLAQAAEDPRVRAFLAMNGFA